MTFGKAVWTVLSCDTMVAILATFMSIVIARIITGKYSHRLGRNKGFLVEFSLIVPQGILFTTVASAYIHYFVGLLIIFLLIYILWTRALSRAKTRREFDLGSRPLCLTVVRALTHLITAVCILAIDFKSFHRPYRKSRKFGATLMDTGIGLFVLTMGLVSRRSRNWVDIRRCALRSTLPLIVLGFVRIYYNRLLKFEQDEHEYGRHMNAFFTLGITKLIGSVLSLVARTDAQLFPMACGLLLTHQLCLSFGYLSPIVMEHYFPRTTLLFANREGIFSLPGFFAIYLLSICFSRWLVRNTLLSYQEMLRKLRDLLLISLSCWLLMAAAHYIVGVARVTCNLGYVIWMCAISITMITLTVFICDFCIDSVISDTLISTVKDLDKLEGRETVPTYIICEALNMNGLTFFLLANLLLSGIKYFLSPESRSSITSLLILFIYMLITTHLICQLNRRGIRIA
ncbi:PREDICTED: uncharacterized protein At4g17910-like [Drosophila arizonae]|uniref:Phosphatidylinositol-glycan biosynthesis class W protein n=1 Tax=Drosophila arizonae TaxID=7263 RepID=A0ABM1P2X0_DROAR|nr:PREDICTED: uncharacterized protein At4g17910-like [Drosophila arizonae]